MIQGSTFNPFPPGCPYAWLPECPACVRLVEVARSPMSDGRIRLMMTTSVIYSRRYSRFGRCERDLAAHAGIPGLGGVSRRIGPPKYASAIFVSMLDAASDLHSRRYPRALCHVWACATLSAVGMQSRAPSIPSSPGMSDYISDDYILRSLPRLAWLNRRCLMMTTSVMI